MTRRRISVGRMAIMTVLGAFALALAGCGGGGGKSTVAVSTVTVTVPAAADATTTTESPSGTSTSTDSYGGGAATTDPAGSQQTDCTAVEDVVTDVQLAFGTNGGLDYLRDRDFLDSYSSRAPAEVADSVDQLRDFFDKFADAAQAAGIKPGAVPLPDQADKLNAALHFSSDEQSATARALTTLDAWTTNGCS